MPSTYSPNLRIELIANGEQSGTWGSTTNNNLGTLIENAISGYVAVPVTSDDQALTALNGVNDQSRNMIIELTGTRLAAFTIYVPPAEKLYVFKNSTNQTATISASTVVNGTTPTSGDKVDIPSGATCIVYCNGTSPYYDIRVANDYIPGNFAVGGNIGIDGNSVIGGNETVTGSLSADSLTLNTPLPASSGGVPAQTGFGSCFLTTDGTTAFWSGTGIKTVAAATTTSLSYPFTGTTTIDDVSLGAGARVLVKDQATASQNGIWVVDASTWSRAADANTAIELAGSIVNVQYGTTQGGTQWATTFKAVVPDAGITANTWNAVIPLPAQSGNTSKFLTTSGTTPSWTSPAAKSVTVATTSSEENITVAGSAPNTVDGVSLSLNDRILVKNQVVSPAQNGVYVVTTVGTGTNGTWARANDANSSADIAGSVVSVQKGTTNGGTQYVTTFKSSNTLGSDAMSWSQLITAATAGGVTTFSGGTTGLTPSTATAGAITLGGALATANGGTGLSGATPFTLNGAVYATSTSALTTGTLPIASGGTGATTAAAARTALGAGTGNGTITQIVASTGLNGGTITSTGTISLKFATSSVVGGIRIGVSGTTCNIYTS